MIDAASDGSIWCNTVLGALVTEYKGTDGTYLGVRDHGLMFRATSVLIVWVVQRHLSASWTHSALTFEII